MPTPTLYTHHVPPLAYAAPELDDLLVEAPTSGNGRGAPPPVHEPVRITLPPRSARRIHRERVAFGMLLVVHGLAHAAPGMWAAGRLPAWFVTPVWLVAMGGFIAAGFGLLGVAGYHRRWQPLVAIAGLSSLMLLLMVGGLALAIGLVLDIALVLTVLEWGDTSGPDVEAARPGLTHGRNRRIASVTLATAFLAWVGLAIAARPWHVRWGTTEAERMLRLPGDELVPVSRYRMDRAVTIGAPADAVWPWLVQIGQDRGGFYSYDRLERLIGDDIHNANRIHPEWQRLERGDLVRATQPGYLGGLFGEDLGWRVAAIEPGRALVLEGWGAFVLRQQPDGTTRLHVRMRQPGVPSVAGVLLGPAGLLLFEPAHFIMERGMLLGIRERVERATRG
jgi:hypothetical protein